MDPLYGQGTTASLAIIRHVQIESSCPPPMRQVHALGVVGNLSMLAKRANPKTALIISTPFLISAETTHPLVSRKSQTQRRDIWWALLAGA